MNKILKMSTSSVKSIKTDYSPWDASCDPAQDPAEELEKPSLWPHLQPNTHEKLPSHVLICIVITEEHNIQGGHVTTWHTHAGLYSHTCRGAWLTFGL